MAKLAGVKTLDMVNGEITKVAYNGAEYERVEGPELTGRHWIKNFRTNDIRIARSFLSGYLR